MKKKHKTEKYIHRRNSTTISRSESGGWAWALSRVVLTRHVLSGWRQISDDDAASPSKRTVTLLSTSFAGSIQTIIKTAVRRRIRNIPRITTLTLRTA